MKIFFFFRTPGDPSEKLESALKELFEELSRQDRGDKSISTKGVIQALGIQRSMFMIGIFSCNCALFVCMRCVVLSG